MNFSSPAAPDKLMPEPGKRYRLITRSDLDGIACVVILRELDVIGGVEFAHPKDMQDGKVPVTGGDIVANLPYVPGSYLCFDHHASEAMRVDGLRARNHVIDPQAPSAARLVFDYFGGTANPALGGVSKEMLMAADRADEARFSRTDILEPQGWVLLAFIMDARTGLGRFRHFRISNYQLMMKLIDDCRGRAIDEILSLPDVKERVDLYRAHRSKCRAQIERCASVHKNLVVLDLRYEETIWASNRFMVYALFPQCNISMHVLWGRNGQNTVFAAGHSILNRTSNTHIGRLMLEYGGGGHERAGTCQIGNDKASRVLRELIARITADG
jgi:nanoRNase/pAp phosphatase (c-di-AMP/oligoRNAs hydrolase)